MRGCCIVFRATPFLIWLHAESVRCLQVLGLQARFHTAVAACAKDPDAEPDELDAAKGIARLWVEIGEAYCTLIASGKAPLSPQHDAGVLRLHAATGLGRIAACCQNKSMCELLDAAKGIARLWVEVGEAYCTLIASGAAKPALPKSRL